MTVHTELTEQVLDRVLRGLPRQHEDPATYVELGSKIGMWTETVRRALRVLESRGVVERTKIDRGRFAFYRSNAARET